MEFFNEWILPHWPWFAAALIFGSIGVGMKRVFTTEVAEKSKLAWWFRATLPLHATFAGIFVGALNVFPTSLGADGRPGGALYFGVAGAASSWIYSAFQHFMEKRTPPNSPGPPTTAG